MPRNPNSPYNNCGPIHTHTSASDNVKLQMLVAKLEDSLRDEFVQKEQLKTLNLESLLGEGNISITSIDKIEKTSSEGLVDTYTIYFNNDREPFSFIIKNGEQGIQGEPGLPTTIKIDENLYHHENSVIDLTEVVNTKLSNYETHEDIINRGYITESEASLKIAELQVLVDGDIQATKEQLTNDFQAAVNLCATKDELSQVAVEVANLATNVESNYATKDSVAQSEAEIFEKITLHETNTDNPHKVTAEQLNVYEKEVVDQKVEELRDTQLDNFNETTGRLFELEKVTHSHENWEVLDGMTASFTAEEKAKLLSISENANNYDDTALANRIQYLEDNPYILPSDVVQDSEYITRVSTIEANIANIPNVVSTGVEEAKAYADSLVSEEVERSNEYVDTKIINEVDRSNAYTNVKVKELADSVSITYYTNTEIDTKIEEINKALSNLQVSNETDIAEAKVYADSLIASEIERADGKYELAGAEERAKAYADGLAGNYDAKGSAEQALVDAKAYANEIKATILGDNTKLVDTYDTLEEIGNWIDTHEGETVVNLTQAISSEEQARKDADDAIIERVVELEKVDHDHSNKDVLDGMTASFTTELLEKLNGIEEGANKYELPSDVVQDSEYFERITTIEEAVSTVDSRISTAISNLDLTGKLDNYYNKEEVQAKFDSAAEAIAEEYAKQTRLDGFVTDLNAHIADTTNPHGVTAEQVGTYSKEEVYTKEETREYVNDNIADAVSGLATTRYVDESIAGALTPDRLPDVLPDVLPDILPEVMPDTSELYKVDFNTPNYAEAKAAYEAGKVLVLINAAPDVNSYALMNYVTDTYITFTKFLMSRSEAYGAFNTYYLKNDNTWEVAKEVRLNKVEITSEGDLQVGKETYKKPSLEGLATETFVNEAIATRAESDHIHEQYLTEHQDISGKVDRTELDNYYTKSQADTEFMTQAEVDARVNEVISKASDTETIKDLASLVDYLDKHGAEAAEMATAISNLETTKAEISYVNTEVSSVTNTILEINNKIDNLDIPEAYDDSEVRELISEKADAEHEHSQYQTKLLSVPYGSLTTIEEMVSAAFSSSNQTSSHLGAISQGMPVPRATADRYGNVIDETYATKEAVEEAINNINIPTVDLTGYATEDFVREEIKNSGHMTIADLQIGEDFITDIKVGHLEAGFEVKSTMTFGDLLKRILRCEHDWIDATCTTPKTCKLCGATEGEPLGHIEETIQGYAADCTNTGLTDGVRCSRCGEILVPQQVIPALGHEFVEISRTDASCETDGQIVYRCSRCNEEKTEVISALGHDYGDWVVTKQPEVGVPGEQQKTCKRCGDVVTEEIPALPKPEEPTTLSYLAGTFGNVDTQEWPEPYIDLWETEEEKEEIAMHYVNNMSETIINSEDDLIGRHGFVITTPFVEESALQTEWGVSEPGFNTRPAIVLSEDYEVIAWNTDVDNNSLSEQTVKSYELTDGRTVYYAMMTQEVGDTITHYLTISKKN